MIIFAELNDDDVEMLCRALESLADNHAETLETYADDGDEFEMLHMEKETAQRLIGYLQTLVANEAVRAMDSASDCR
jgi:hypothetical protein